jgi:pimeloyl-ACP methyl ester carboxylesterase
MRVALARLAEKTGALRDMTPGLFTATTLADARRLATRMNAKRLPSEIPEDVFAGVLLDWLQGVSLPAALRADDGAAQVVPYDLAELWQRMNRRADGDQSALRAEMLAWYRQVTDRMTGEFKRKIRIVLYIVGALVVLVTNADSINIARTLYGDPTLRAQVVATAENIAAKCPNGIESCPDYHAQMREILSASSREASSELLGWRTDSRGRYSVAWWSPAGWLLTILAIGMGADFWFGALRRIVSLKSADSGVGGDASRAAGERPDAPSRIADMATPVSRDPIDINDERLAPLKGFQPLRYAESNVHAFWFAQFSSLAYNSAMELEASDLLAHHELTITAVSGGSTQVFVFQGAQALIVAFRGTEQLPEDWITDLDAKPKLRPWDVKGESIFVHTGFADALDAVWAQLRPLLLASKHPVWFTGHSLGGALAVLAAYRLSQCEGPVTPTVGGVYTFGQPRVGNPDLARSIPAQLSQRIFRYVNSSDIVPLVPPSTPVEYVHFGNVRYFDAAGCLHLERTLWERVAAELTPALGELGRDPDWGKIAKQHLAKRVADHAMTRYVQCLERIDTVAALRA